MKTSTETGLRLFPRTSQDTITIMDIMDSSDYAYEFDAAMGCLFFEEIEENYDSLESYLIGLLNDSNANYRIEGIF